MGQSSSKNRAKGRKETSTLRVPVYNGSFGRGYKFKTSDGILNVPADKGVRNKFHSAPRARPRSNENSSKGVIVYKSSSDNGNPVGHIHPKYPVRKPVSEIFESVDKKQKPMANGHGPHTHNDISENHVVRDHRTYNTYSRMTVGELKEKQYANRKSRTFPAEVHWDNKIQTSEIQGNHIQTTRTHENHTKPIDQKRHYQSNPGHNGNHHQKHFEGHGKVHKKSSEGYGTGHTNPSERSNRKHLGHKTSSEGYGTGRRTPQQSHHSGGHRSGHHKSSEGYGSGHTRPSEGHKKPADLSMGRRAMQTQVYRHVSENGYKVSSPPNRPPFVPPWGTKRDMVPNPKMFADIDAHALKCPPEACNSLRSLVTYLSQPAKNDLQRIRVIFRWMTHFVRYDMNAVLAGTYKSLPCDPESVLHTRRAVCQGFANLFAALCREVDIMVKILTGFSKDFYYDPEEPLQDFEDCNHAWNIVYVHGEWRPVDCTWGSGFIDDNNRFRTRFNEFFFLTDPDKFVWSHFPVVKEGLRTSTLFQLLSRPISLEEFNSKISPSQAAIEWGLELMSHRESIIRVDRYIRIDFRVHKVKLLNVVCKFKNKENGEEFGRYVVCRRRGDGLFSATVYPPYEGNFSLKLFGHPEDNAFYQSPMVSYTISCSSAISRIQPYPENEGLWGVKVDPEKYGFSEDIYQDDFFVTDDGELDFFVRMHKPTSTLLKLQHAVQDIPSLNDYVITEYKYTGFKVKVRFPLAGYYKLSLFGKPLDSEGNRVDLIADFLVQCKLGLPDCLPFPKTFTFTQDSMSVLLEPDSGILPAGKTVTYVISSEKLKRVLVDERGSPPAYRMVFRGQIEPKPAGSFVSLFGNMDGGVDHEEVFRFSVVDTRQGVRV